MTAIGASEVVSVPPAIPTSIWPERDLVGHRDRGLDGVARLLDVVGRRLGCELGAEHRLAGQVEVAGVLEHAGDDLAEPLPLEAVAGDQAVDRAVSMSWLDAWEYTVFERAKGIRFRR